MSLIMTESWMWAPRFTDIDNSGGGVNDGGRNYFASGAVAQMGYVVMQTNPGGSPAAGWAIRNDPVIPDRAALVCSVVNNSQSGGTGAGISFPLPPRGSNAFIIGFSLFIPSNYSSAGTAPVMGCAFTNLTGANNGVFQGGGINAFYIRQDLAVASSASTAIQSPVRLQAGAANYVELRYDGTTTSVWIDDVLVHQHTGTYTNLNYFQIGFARIANFQLLVARWAISNIYALLEDGTAPNTRLGKTTRVLGKRPQADVVTELVRPPEASTNAEVVAQNVIASPSSFLIAQEVGDTDLYSASDINVVGSPIVHAVSVKALVANNAAAVHGATVLVDSSSVEGESAETSLPVLGGFQLVRGNFPVDPATGLPWEGIAASEAAFGLRASS